MIFNAEKAKTGNHRPLGGQAGFSLVEITVALGILIIGILGVVPMLTFNIKANTAARNYGYANLLAQQKFEQIRSWRMWEDHYDAAGNVDNYGISSNNTALFGSEVIKYGTYQSGDYQLAFTRTAELVRNGYDTLDCDGIKFESGGTYDEGLTTGLGSLNTGDVGEKCASGNYRGEDFKVVRTTVAWKDRFGSHSVVRHMYLAQF